MIVDYIDAHRDEFGVEPICSELQVAPSTYYEARSRPPSARSISDAARLETIRQVHADNYGAYGVTKVHAELRRRGHRVACCTVRRLMPRCGPARHQPCKGATDHSAGHRTRDSPGPGRT